MTFIPKKGFFLNKGSYTVVKDGIDCVISKDYFYKTESYYEIILKEINGEDKVFPNSKDVLDAYVVPIALKRAEISGIPTCNFEISYGYVPFPSIVYSLNYFSDPSIYYVVKNCDESKKASKHVTNCGKYPLCYQNISEDSSIVDFSVIFGQTDVENEQLKYIAGKIYEIFKIPLLKVLCVNKDGKMLLSSISPLNTSKLTKKEKELIEKTLLVD
ncbi:conserved hypothetical protein [Methanococcus vannielii SB]|uniref:RimK-like ATPgrasp N-terminal domain-containing protein n=1 Tax=Methanococcus vannielii (strain ATCC 35089 / DSM 1224 / JCM 13029 / OCM 148 / SB) TaxID=406327 RepID=A6US44_METVS|nr:RimK-like ATPgrasp N-terminal domain-containing protein [Methanococcus vannielii]ABR55316.1 conserved hypothetical protein [Methanococcus vannielii SB]